MRLGVPRSRHFLCYLNPGRSIRNTIRASFACHVGIIQLTETWSSRVSTGIWRTSRREDSGGLLAAAPRDLISRCYPRGLVQPSAQPYAMGPHSMNMAPIPSSAVGNLKSMPFLLGCG
jgi:hypothetical protein